MVLCTGGSRLRRFITYSVLLLSVCVSIGMTNRLKRCIISYETNTPRVWDTLLHCPPHLAFLQSSSLSRSYGLHCHIYPRQLYSDHSHLCEALGTPDRYASGPWPALRLAVQSHHRHVFCLLRANNRGLARMRCDLLYRRLGQNQRCNHSPDALASHMREFKCYYTPTIYRS